MLRRHYADGGTLGAAAGIAPTGNSQASITPSTVLLQPPRGVVKHAAQGPNHSLTSSSLSGSSKRIQKELAELSEVALGTHGSAHDREQYWPRTLYFGGPKGDDLYSWLVVLEGPSGSPYAGGVFFLDLTFPPDYPFNAPRLIFRSRIYHCNVSSRGNIRGTVLDAWSSACRVSDVMDGLCQLMREPSENEAASPALAHQMTTDRAKYLEIAREWTRRFAR
ncbi:Constitutive photomorphogenesis protein 10 [Porphyridium purpureum]|uniref:Constitutive photomorphogenesis protein 10 n=1 Tax=Porphyridium purpureum TaxID=35688 RepID=A0A5J4YLW5_PORPP|nr:Constitutive photomorphogenesis protein 10 [Porphyridium purpureum]|eukprot:POR5154..scf210_14